MTFDPSKTRMFCYDGVSESGRELARKLGVLTIRLESSTFIGDDSHLIINWGASPKRWLVRGHGYRVINQPSKVRNVIDKIRFYTLISDWNKNSDCPVHIPDWTVEGDTALSWLEQGHCVLARNIIAGSNGNGISIMEKALDFIPAKVYTKYIPKKREYRFYLVNGKIVDWCAKKRKLSETPENWKIRSRENGFIYTWVDTEPANVIQVCGNECLKALALSGLDFAGVDVIFGAKDGKPYILEINSAPWLSESTAAKMAEEIKLLA